MQRIQLFKWNTTDITFQTLNLDKVVRSKAVCWMIDSNDAWVVTEDITDLITWLCVCLDGGREAEAWKAKERCAV